MEHYNTLTLVSRLIFARSKLLALTSGLIIASEQGKVMEDNGSSYRHVQRSSLVSILWNVDKMVTHSDLIIIEPASFIPKHEECVTPKRLLLDWSRLRHDLNATD